MSAKPPASGLHAVVSPELIYVAGHAATQQDVFADIYSPSRYFL